MSKQKFFDALIIVLSDCDKEQIRQIVDAAVLRAIRNPKGEYGELNDLADAQMDVVDLMRSIDWLSDFDPDNFPKPDPADVYAAHWDNW